MAASLPIALDLAGGSIIFLVFVVALFVAVAYGYYSRRGSAIDQHPRGAHQGGTPGVGSGPSRISSAEDENEGRFSSHGTR